MIDIVRLPTIGLTVCLLGLCAAPVGHATAQAQPVPQSKVELLADDAIPSSVKAKLDCRKTAGAATVRSFSGGFVFAQPCEQSEGSADRLVFATDRDGKNARLLTFHRPEGRRVQALKNVAYLNGGTEISGHVGRLTRRICRAEGRWRMEGKTPEPGLVYWRQTADCDGKTGWQLIVNRAGPRR